MQIIASTFCQKAQRVTLGELVEGENPFIVKVGTVEYRHDTMDNAKRDYLAWVQSQLDGKIPPIR